VLLSRRYLRVRGIHGNVRDVVLQRAQQAVAAGCDGVIASGHEAADLRASLGPHPLIVTPGIRPANNTSKDDQKRIVTPALAIERGANYLVIGRPIRTAPKPREAAEAIQAEIATALHR
jgi:orotidine-5'-phosphate decarboxylase